MLCPFRIKGAKADWIAKHPEDFECLRECAWLMESSDNRYGACAVAEGVLGTSSTFGVRTIEFDVTAGEESPGEESSC